MFDLFVLLVLCVVLLVMLGGSVLYLARYAVAIWYDECIECLRPTALILAAVIGGVGMPVVTCWFTETTLFQFIGIGLLGIGLTWVFLVVSGRGFVRMYYPHVAFRSQWNLIITCLGSRRENDWPVWIDDLID